MGRSRFSLMEKMSKTFKDVRTFLPVFPGKMLFSPAFLRVAIGTDVPLHMYSFGIYPEGFISPAPRPPSIVKKGKTNAVRLTSENPRVCLSIRAASYAGSQHCLLGWIVVRKISSGRNVLARLSVLPSTSFFRLPRFFYRLACARQHLASTVSPASACARTMSPVDGRFLASQGPARLSSHPSSDSPSCPRRPVPWLCLTSALSVQGTTQVTFFFSFCEEGRNTGREVSCRCEVRVRFFVCWLLACFSTLSFIFFYFYFVQVLFIAALENFNGLVFCFIKAGDVFFLFIFRCTMVDIGCCFRLNYLLPAMPCVVMSHEHEADRHLLCCVGSRVRHVLSRYLALHMMYLW